MANPADHERLGWVALFRKAEKWPLFDDNVCWRLLTLFMIRAARKPTRQLFRGRLFELARGQLIVNLSDLESRFGYSRAQLRRAMTLMEEEGTITTNNAANRGKLITLCNFGVYDGLPEEKKPTEKPTGNQPTTNRQPTDNQTTEQPVNQEPVNQPKTPNLNPSLKREGLSPEEAWEEFWETYPNKGYPERGLKNFMKAVEVAPVEQILSAGRAFARSRLGRSANCPTASTWLKRAQWNDDPSEWETVDVTPAEQIAQARDSISRTKEMLRDSQNFENDGEGLPEWRSALGKSQSENEST